eukprot:Colp12_sorted_trinity150504_noHs@16448
MKSQVFLLLFVQAVCLLSVQGLDAQFCTTDAQCGPDRKCLQGYCQAYIREGDNCYAPGSICPSNCVCKDVSDFVGYFKYLCTSGNTFVKVDTSALPRIGNIRIINNISVEDCQKACRSNSACKNVVYVREQKQCYLKRGGTPYDYVFNTKSDVYARL